MNVCLVLRVHKLKIERKYGINVAVMERIKHLKSTIIWSIKHSRLFLMCVTMDIAHSEPYAHGNESD